MKGTIYISRKESGVRPFRVIGEPSDQTGINVWYYDDLLDANHFAQHLANRTKKEVEVALVTDVYRPIINPPIEHICIEEDK